VFLKENARSCDLFAFKTKPLAGYVHLAKNSVDAKKCMKRSISSIAGTTNAKQRSIIGTVSQFWMQIGLPFAIGKGAKECKRMQKNIWRSRMIQVGPPAPGSGPTESYMTSRRGVGQRE